jgi:hypothetical protein
VQIQIAPAFPENLAQFGQILYPHQGWQLKLKKYPKIFRF